MSVRILRVMAVLEPGGAQLSALRLTKALRALGFETDVVAGHATPEGVALFEAAGVAVEVWGGRPGLQYECSPGFARWLEPRAAGADLVHAGMFGAWWAAAGAVPEHVPLVASEHNAIRWPGPERTQEMRAALRRVDAFFAHGPATGKLVLGLGLPATRLHGGLSPVGGLEGRPSALPVANRIVFAGRLHEEKGPDLLVEALVQMRAPASALFLGAGPQEGALRRRVGELGLAERVRFRGWVADPGALLGTAAACAVPSRHDAWSQTAVLAMGLGVPVVGAGVEGLPETLAHGRGVVVAPDNPAALAAGLDAVLAGRAALDPAAAHAYALQFTPARVAQLYAGVYRSLAGRGWPGARAA